MYRKVYKITPIIDNSFDKTSKVLVDFVLSKFLVESTTYKNSLNPDDVQVGGDLSNMRKPEYIYLTFNYLANGWTNWGGHQYCQCKLKDGSKILINWDISSKDDSEDINSQLLSISRKMKLEKLNLKQN